jgi:hypothetical protein
MPTTFPQREHLHPRMHTEARHETDDDLPNVPMGDLLTPEDSAQARRAWPLALHAIPAARYWSPSGLVKARLFKIS